MVKLLAMTSPELDSLPVDIVKRIASYSPCKSALALLLVNRRLYEVCNDHLVFKAILHNGNGRGMKVAWDLDFLSENTSSSACARFALADSMAQRWIAKLQSLTENEAYSGEDTSPGVGDWAPQLIFLQHPFVAEVDLTALVSQLKLCSRRDVKEYGAIAFCLAAAILQQGLSALEHEDTEALLHPIYGKIHQAQVALLSTSGPSPLVIAGILACGLVSSHKTFAGHIKPPSPRKIPFRSFLDFPLPFSGTNEFHEEDTDSLHCLRESTALSFLVDGEWVGYYCYFVKDGIRFDAPMQGIHFSAKPDSSPGGQGFALTATGRDGLAQFSLTGHIHPTGVVKMTTYYSWYSWKWIGSMTSLGIVGKWGTPRRENLGLFWLWKREWSYS